MTKPKENQELETLILCFLTNEWQTTGQITKLCNKPRRVVGACLGDLVIQKRIEYKIISNPVFDQFAFKLNETSKDENQTELFK